MASKRQKKKKGREKICNKKSGITLIALVITIIVLLILVGVTIGMLVGDNGIITRTIKAEEETKKAQYEELINIIILEKKIQRSQNPKEEDPFIKVVADAIDKKEWSKTVTICDEYANTEIGLEKCNRIIVETKDGYEIIVKLDNENLTGEVVSISKGTTPTWKVTFEANGGRGEVPKAMEIKKGFSIKLPEGEHLTQTDQKIVGWSKVKKPENEKDKIYTIGSSYHPTQEQTALYAIWEEDISATLNVTNNKFTEGTKISLGGSAIAHGIQKVELKVGDNILYEENINEKKTTYNKSNLGLDGLKQDSLFKLSFYDIMTLQFVITSTTGQIGTTNVNIRNYTIGNDDALRRLIQVVNGENSLRGETILQLTNLSTAEDEAPIGENKY